MGTSLRELRRLAGIKSGDVLILEATATSVTANAFTDETRLGDRGDQSSTLLQKLLYFSEIADGNTSGANVGHSAQVGTFSSTTRTLGYSPPSPAPPELGDICEMWQVSERIGSIRQINMLINHAIAAVEEQAAVETYAPDETFNARTGRLTIPDSWRGGTFGGVDWVDRQGYVREIRPGQLIVRPGAMTVTITGRGAEQAHLRTVRMYGYPKAPQLAEETDETLVDREWIVESVASAITLGPSWRSGDSAAAERRANFWATRADGYRRNTWMARRGLDISLPEQVG